MYNLIINFLRSFDESTFWLDVCMHVVVYLHLCSSLFSTKATLSASLLSLSCFALSLMRACLSNTVSFLLANSVMYCFSSLWRRSLNLGNSWSLVVSANSHGLTTRRRPMLAKWFALDLVQLTCLSALGGCIPYAAATLLLFSVQYFSLSSYRCCAPNLSKDTRYYCSIAYMLQLTLRSNCLL